MGLIFRDDFGLIRAKGKTNETKDGLSIAILNKLAFRGLDQIVRSRNSRCDCKDCTRQHIVIKDDSGKTEEKRCSPIRQDIWISLIEWNKKLEEHRQLPPYSRKIVRMNADIVLFGPRSMGDSIAKELGDAQLFVQKPHFGSYSGHYDNPQSMHLPHLDLADLQATQSLIDSLEEQNESQPQPENQSDLALTDLVWNIDQFFDKLPTHDSLIKVDIDRRKVLTPLLR
jgi:hypothetical protein